MSFIKLTRVNAQRWNGTMSVNSESIVAMQRFEDHTDIMFGACASDGGLVGFSVEETPDEIEALIRRTGDSTFPL